MSFLHYRHAGKKHKIRTLLTIFSKSSSSLQRLGCSSFDWLTIIVIASVFCLPTLPAIIKVFHELRSIKALNSRQFSLKFTSLPDVRQCIYEVPVLGINFVELSAFNAFSWYTQVPVLRRLQRQSPLHAPPEPVINYNLFTTPNSNRFQAAKLI